MLSRRKFAFTASTAFGAVAGLRFPAGAAEFTYKLGHDNAPTLPTAIHTVDAADKIKLESNGRIEIQIFPDDQLGNGHDMLSQVRLGAIQFTRLSFADVAGDVPAANADGLPYVYGNYKQAYEARDGSWGAYLRGAVAKRGMYMFDKVWEYGFRQVCNTVRPINQPDDLKGLKLRVSPAPAFVSFFQALGAAPVPLSINALYTSLQTHLVDGLEQGLGPMYSHKYYELAKYISITDHISTGAPLLANGDAWRKLPKQLRDIVDRNFNAAAIADRAEVAAADPATIALMRAKGMVDNHADVEAFKAAVRKAGLYAKWRDQYGTEVWSALEKSVGPLR